MTHPHPYVVTAVIFVVVSFFIFLLSQYWCAIRLDRYITRNRVNVHVYFDIYVAAWRIITTASLVSAAFHCHDINACKTAFFLLFLAQVLLLCISAALCILIDYRCQTATTGNETLAITLGGVYPLFTGLLYALLAGGLTLYLDVI